MEAAEGTFRIRDGEQIIAEVPRTATKPIARFKVRKPEPARSASRCSPIEPDVEIAR